MPRRDTGAPSRLRIRDIRFRPIRPDDWRRLQRFHRRLSEGTVELRFHAAKRELSEPLAHHFTALDFANDYGIVATTGTRGRIVGVARYNRIDNTSAEVAFVIEDAYQHHGLGRKLMAHLVRAARRNGIAEFVAEVMPGNNAMMQLLREVGPARVRFDGCGYEVRVDLGDAPT